MTPQLLLTVSQPLGNEDGCADDSWADRKIEDFSDKVNLDLRIGSCASANEGGMDKSKKSDQEKEKSFTSLQLHEFRNQILAYNFIASGLPIPLTCLAGFIPARLDCMMDPEPGRCRRTDGRKWRCSKNSIPNQKYCDRHMHRGLVGGSRKLVESSGSFSGPKNITLATSLGPSDKDKRISVPVQSEPDFSFFNNGDHTGEKDTDSTKNAKTKKINGGKFGADTNNYVGFGLSPNSVLQCGAEKVTVALNGENITETEPQRCRRTDGKKWQCSREAISNQKYCESHMHRGAKRRALNPESVTINTNLEVPRNYSNEINLNKAPAIPQNIVGKGNDSASSVSDATTITDEAISICRT